MKKILPIVAFVFIGSTFACDQATELDNGCIRVRTVAEVCGNAVLQVMEGAMEGLEDSWSDGEGNVYDNVFFTALNPCDENYRGTGQEFFVRIVDENQSAGCAACRATVPNPPNKFLHIIIIEDCIVEGDIF